MDIITILSELDTSRLIFFIVLGFFAYLGPALIKKKYLKRKKITVDEKLEDRNSWLFFPDGYNYYEKFLLFSVYALLFFLGILGVNL